ncbi:uncharacterized protein LOC107426307 isoform X2 [Ziziphus jujuba]|uniref:Uncharacterized protein LOC107426307 isoform X2 n=1 Tax=Ziziphus jujuba TaxID=326968 RepID=A0ABM3I005_ZIZJJ|nr:uncharacterized protein LOC107426307 isoform X2 [Ziziphus jujuba]
MWRQQSPPVPANPDSDQSISEEEESGHDWQEIRVPLSGPSDKKEEFQLASRLEILKERRTCTLEDEVEIPDFPEEADFICSPKKGNNVLPEVSHTLGDKKFEKDAVCSLRSEKLGRSYPWSAATKEAERLMFLNENAACFSKAKNSSRGGKGKGKGKPKFSFHFQSHKDGHWPSTSKTENHKLPERLNTTELRTEEDIGGELLEDIQGEEENQSDIVLAQVEALGHGHTEQSIAELLDGLQDKTILLRGNRKMCRKTRGKRAHLIVKKTTSLGDRTFSNEDSPELMGSGSSSDDETRDQALNLAVLQTKRQTMVDRFQEALCATSFNVDEALVAVHKPSRLGLFVKLQQVMQSEKERDLDFLKKLQSKAIENDERDCISGKILARYFDAKLIVCECLFSENQECIVSPDCSKEMINDGTKMTLIFNPRVCNDVDLEVGNFIRIHSPWRYKSAMTGPSFCPPMFPKFRCKGFSTLGLGFPMRGMTFGILSTTSCN